MKWNIEWVDLKNIEQMAAECWRMSERQLVQYCRELSEKQDLVFAGELGRAFFLMLCEALDKHTPLDWSKLQKDVRYMLEMIDNGQKEDEAYWLSRYKELSADAAAYFYSGFGRAFIRHLADKLELNLTEDQRLLRRDLYTIQGICDTCNWENTAEVQKAISILKRKEKDSFSSWLGEGFIELLEERYEKKETIIDEIQAELEQELKTQQGSGQNRRHKWSKKKTLFCVLAACISTGGIAAGLYVKTQGAAGTSDIISIFGQLFTDSSEYHSDGRITERSSSQTGRALSDGQDAGSAVNTAAGHNDMGSSQSGVGGQGPSGSGQSTLDYEQSGNGRQEAAGGESAAGQGTAAGGESITGQNTAAGQGTAAGSESAAGRGTAAGSESTAGQDVSVDGGSAADSRGTSPDGQSMSGSSRTTGSDQNKGSKKTANPKILPQYRTFYNKYPDLFGWLKIPNTEIDHPIMQSDDEKRGERYYYLHRDYTGKRAEEGSLFVESRSSCYPQDDNTVIYGHNMSNGHNFGILENYKDKDYYKNHQTIQYDTIYETGTYQIAAVFMSRVLYQEEEGFRYYHFYNYSSKSEYQECLDFINENKLYDTGIKLQYGDKLLMLSTCEYSRENGRLVVVAKRVESN